MFAIAQMVGDYAGYRLADKKVDEIEHSLANLEDFPHIGTVRNEIVPGLRALPAAEKATICFIVNDEARIVKIVCVTYAGRDWQKIAKAREQRP
jgi:plasmid stabilization system protein ParE